MIAILFQAIEAWWWTYISKITTTDSNDGLSPGRRQAIIWTHAIVESNLRNKLQWYLSEIHAFSCKKMPLKMSVKWWQFCIALNVLSRRYVLYIEAASAATLMLQVSGFYWAGN